MPPTILCVDKICRAKVGHVLDVLGAKERPQGLQNSKKCSLREAWFSRKRLQQVDMKEQPFDLYVQEAEALAVLGQQPDVEILHRIYGMPLAVTL